MELEGVVQNGVIVPDDATALADGTRVRIIPATPDDPGPGMEKWLAELHAMGPMEFEPGEQDLIAGTLTELDRVSKAALQNIARIQT